MVLISYRIASEIALWVARIGMPFWPERWRVQERIFPPPNPPLSGGRARVEGAVWLHAASLGECKGLWAFARILRDLDADFVLTANTAAGLDFLNARITSDHEPDRFRAMPAPLDHPRVARRFLEAFDVRALVLFEMELWPHWIFAAQRFRRAGVPVLWISARWNARARRRYGLFPGAARRVLRALAWIQAQDADTAALLRAARRGDAAGAMDAADAGVSVGADLRGLAYFDTAGTPRIPGADGRARRGIAFVSFHAEELNALVPLLEAARSENPLIVFPRKPEELPAFQKALAPMGFVTHSKNPGASRVIVDRFGLVPETLARVRLAIVGGSFAPRGGHNLWEPLLAGCAIAAGPHLENQAWLADRLLRADRMALLDGPESLVKLLAEPMPTNADDAVHALRCELERCAFEARDRVFEAAFRA